MREISAQIIILILSGIIVPLASVGQEVFQLWESGTKPYYKENNLVEHEKEIWGTICAANITEPTLTVYPPQGENSGKAVLIIPGGGYEIVAMHHEGYDVAKFLSDNGITAAVLKYRLPLKESSDQPHLVPLADARQGMKLLRSLAKLYDFGSNQVGVVGFSAGSHLATVLGLWTSENVNENPNFLGLIYGVTDLSDANLKWLEESLYHRALSQEEISQNRLLELISSSTPPSFLVHAYDDEVCLLKETTLYQERLVEHQVPVETHLFPTGGHGFGLGRKEDGTDQWPGLFVNWVKRLD